MELEADEAGNHEGHRRRGEHSGEDHQHHQRGETPLPEDVADAVRHRPAHPYAHQGDLGARARQEDESTEDAEEADRIHAEDPGRPGRREEHTGDRRPDEAGNLKREAVQRDRALEVLRRDRSGQHGLEGREAERSERPADEGEQAHEEDRQVVRGPEDGERDGNAHVPALEEEEDLPAVEVVGEHSGREGEEEVRDRVEETDDPERRRRAAEQKDDVAEGARLHPAPREGEQHPAEVDLESPMAKSGRPRLPLAPTASRPDGRLRDRSPEQGVHPTGDRVCVEAPVPQPVRHTDARRLAQSGAGEDERAGPRQLV